ncbi:hypothetical protein PM082_004858 [Marasmius tenuissimus]|nr:hypothetical protein PM082_004858 [Marasmius tenuissimus]
MPLYTAFQPPNSQKGLDPDYNATNQPMGKKCYSRKIARFFFSSTIKQKLQPSKDATPGQQNAFIPSKHHVYYH